MGPKPEILWALGQGPGLRVQNFRLETVKMAAIIRAGCSFASLYGRRGVYWKSISTTQNLFDDKEKLEKAKQRVMELTEDPGNENKLQLYALYKQVSIEFLRL